MGVREAAQYKAQHGGGAKLEGLLVLTGMLCKEHASELVWPSQPFGNQTPTCYACPRCLPEVTLRAASRSGQPCHPSRLPLAPPTCSTFLAPSSSPSCTLFTANCSNRRTWGYPRGVQGKEGTSQGETDVNQLAMAPHAALP